MVNAKATIAAFLVAGTLSAPVQAHPAVPVIQPQDTSLHHCGWGKVAWDGVVHFSKEIGFHILIDFLKSFFETDKLSKAEADALCQYFQDSLNRLKKSGALTAKEKAAIADAEAILAAKCSAVTKTTILQKSN